MNDYYIFLDDWRYQFMVNWVDLPKSDRWVHAHHYYDFIHIVKSNGVPRFISWDYDLDRQPLPVFDEQHPYKTGYDCALWLIEFCKQANLPVPPGAIHSTNAQGGPLIAQVLNDYNQTRQPK